VSACWIFKYLLEAVSWTLPEMVNSPAVASAATTADVPSMVIFSLGALALNKRNAVWRREWRKSTHTFADLEV
jgi:hypothetical protein